MRQGSAGSRRQTGQRSGAASGRQEEIEKILLLEKQKHKEYAKESEAKQDELEQMLRLEKKKSDGCATIIKMLQIDREKRTKDIQNLKEQLTETSIQLAAEQAVARKKLAVADVELLGYKERTKNLEERVRDLEKEIARLKKKPEAKPAVKPKDPVRNQPTFDVEGKVMTVKNDLLEITVGSDAGLLKGHTLDVFRLGTKPQYLGMVRLITVEPTRAVARSSAR